MKITFSARHFDPTPKLQSFAIEEISKIEKHLKGHSTCEVVLEESGNLKVVDIRLNALSKVFKARVEDNDFYKIIPKAVNKLEKQFKSEKSKARSR